MKLPLWRRRQDEELHEELATHLRMAVADRIDRGEDPLEAERAARREFGNAPLVAEVTRDMWGWTPVERVAKDVRYAIRMLRRSPGFTAVAVLTLALGIGANTAMFSVINAVLLRPLPFPAPDRLVAISGVDLRPSRRGASMSASWPDFFDIRTRARTLERVTAFHQIGLTMTRNGLSRHVPVAVASADFFLTLGIQPALGRGFLPDEERAGSDVAVISDGLWRSEFAADPAILGRTFTLNSRPFTIVGVAPPGFRFPMRPPAPEVWITSAEDARIENPGDTAMTTERGAHFLEVIGRLTASATLAAAQRELDRITESLAREHPEDNANRGIRVVSELESLVGETRQPLYVLLAAVACVLLIACVNMANLLLARGAGREREMALRAALGASSGRVVAQLLVESLVLAVIGSAAGLLLAYGSLAMIVRLAPVSVRGLDDVRIDAAVLAFTGLVAVMSAIVFGLMPSLQSARTDAAGSAATTARSTQGPGQRRLRAALVVAETAIGVVLLVGAGLLLRSFDRLLQTPPGFDPQNVVTATFRLPDSRYAYSKQIAFYDALLDDLKSLPGVEATAAAVPLPLSRSTFGISFQLPGGSTAPSERLSASIAVVSPGYFAALHVPMVRGRDFTARDNDAAPRVTLVNESFARKYFPDVDPIGQRIKAGLQTTEKETPWREIVGVVADVHHHSLAQEVQPAYFIPYAQGLVSPLTLVVRTSDTAGAGEQLRKALMRRDPELALYNVKAMDEYVSASVATPRFQTLLLAVFAAVGLVLTASGLYGVMAYGVAQRTREFGIRLALGARPAEVLTMVIRGGLALIAAGLVTGIVAGAMATRLLASALYGISPLDPMTFTAVAGVLLAVALAACYVPARRATRVDPIAALRAE